jgi:hypothetical protein
MRDSLPRRQFLEASAVFGLGASLGAEARAITPESAEAMAVKPEAVKLRPEIEPVVRWIEETPRDRVLNVAIEKLKEGLSYRELMAGLFLAGVRNIKPRPVGFKFHAVMVIHSAHLLGQSAAVDERLLPMLWALDTFKSSQAADEKEGDWALGPVDEKKLPKSWGAKKAFVNAMEAWDSEAADAATVAFCRSHGAAEVMEEFWRFAIRDQRNIGHKAIFAAQAWRTLQAIGWQNAEPVLRSLAFGLLDRQGKPGTDVVGPYLDNLEVAKTFPEHWSAGAADRGASDNMLDELRHASARAAGSGLTEYINGSVSPDAVWDGVLKCANELLLRKPGIIALHAVTAVNALHFIYGAAADETTRRMAMLQAASWVAMFRESIGDAPKFKINAMEPMEVSKSPADAIAEIFAAIKNSRLEAARKTLGFLKNGGTNEAVFAAARRMIFLKGRDSHDYKFGAAAWEESVLASTPGTRSLLTAAMMGHLPSSASPDSPLMIRSREAVSTILK